MSDTTAPQTDTALPPPPPWATSLAVSLPPPAADPPPVKPGWRTTEFYLSSAAVLLGVLYASGLITTGSPWDRLAGIAATLLAAMGYTVVRGSVKSAAAALLVVALGSAVASQTACISSAQVADAPGAAETAVIDCTRADAPAVIALLGQLGADAVTAVLHTGAVDWGHLEASAIAQGKVVGGCALAELVAELSAAPASSTPARVAGAPDLAADGQAALDRLRAALGGVRWSTRSGVM